MKRILVSIPEDVQRVLEACPFECNLPREGPCLAASPTKSQTFCTRPAGHEGVHAACGSLVHPGETWSD